MPPSPAIIRIQKKKPVPHPEDLPEHLMADILSRLPVKTIIHCKCVCKKWLDLISDSYFADLQLSRSPAGLMIYHIFERERTVGILRWIEVEDELDHYPVMSVDLDLSPIFQNTQIHPLPSVNGLLCLRHFEKTYICNPITREYMILPRPQYYTLGSARGFGVSSLTREYKVIRIFQAPDSTSTSQPSLLEAEVYTIGTGQWRSVGHAPRLSHSYAPIFLNGHAHWIVIDEDSPEKLCAFDFDKETFKLFPSPPSEAIDEYRFHKTLGILKGCLCQCDSDEFKLTVWVMKEYGIKKSWHKELVMEKNISIGVDLEALEIVYILDGLTDGTILMASYQDTLFVYCPQRKTIVDREIFGYCLKVQAYRPSFHRLKSFEKERVHVF